MEGRKRERERERERERARERERGRGRAFAQRELRSARLTPRLSISDLRLLSPPRRVLTPTWLEVG